MRIQIISWLFLLAFPCLSQGSGITVYGVDTRPAIDQYNLVTLDSLDGIVTLADIYRWHRPTWIKTYHQVKISSSCDEKMLTAIGINDTLSKQQIELLSMADMDCKVTVEVDYLPNNKLAETSAQKINFSLRVVPIREATYPGGYSALQAYLKSSTIDQIPSSIFSTIEVAKLQFRITATGQVTDAQIVTTTNDEATDQLLLEAVCQMSTWQPAKDRLDQPVSQQFELSIGTLLLQGCYQY